MCTDIELDVYLHTMPIILDKVTLIEGHTLHTARYCYIHQIGENIKVALC
jgi:hypothetical protein